MRQLVLLCLVATALCVNEVTIDLYMESECPGCMAFVNGELKRALATKDFQKIAKIQVFPYGNAHQSQNADGTWSFTCQHGPTECYGNLLEVCAMSRIQEYKLFCSLAPTRNSDTFNASRSISEDQQLLHLMLPLRLATPNSTSALLTSRPV